MADNYCLVSIKQLNDEGRVECFVRSARDGEELFITPNVVSIIVENVSNSPCKLRFTVIRQVAHSRGVELKGYTLERFVNGNWVFVFTTDDPVAYMDYIKNNVPREWRIRVVNRFGEVVNP